MPKDAFWKFKAAADDPKKGELYLYGPISTVTWWGDEVTPTQFKEDLDALGTITELHLYINSDGGDVFAGHSIHSMIRRKAETGVKTVGHVDGVAASIASVIAMGCDELRMPGNSMLMVHEPWMYTAGNSTELRKKAETLDEIGESIVAAYKRKTGLPEDEIRAIMKAETWFIAKKAVDKGFADVLEEDVEVAASMNAGILTINGQQFDMSRYRNPPNLAFVPRAAPAPPTTIDKQAGDPGLLSLWAWQLQANRNRF